MAKLNQIIAVVTGKKSRVQRELTDIHHSIQKPELLNGLSRVYQPLAEGDEQLPPESKQVQMRTSDAIARVTGILTDMFDTILTQDTANCTARASLHMDGHTIAEDVPVTYLLFLEKQLTDIRTFVEKLPTLDPAEEWRFDEAKNCWVTATVETTRTKKVPKVVLLHPPTKEHPAQTQMVAEDVIVGHYKTTKFSGAMPALEKANVLGRIDKLMEAVKEAREAANSIDAPQVRIGSCLFEYIFQ